MYKIVLTGVCPVTDLLIAPTYLHLFMVSCVCVCVCVRERERERERERISLLQFGNGWCFCQFVCVSGVTVIEENPVRAFGIISQGRQTARGVAV